MQIFKELKGGSLSRTVVIQDGTHLFVRKYISFRKDREYGLVRWHSQIRKLQLLYNYLPNLCVKIIRTGTDNDCYFYDIPYFPDYVDCYAALIRNKCRPDFLSDKIVDLLRRLSCISFDSVLGSLSVYVNEEILNPLIIALDYIDSASLPMSSEESLYFKESILRIIPKVKLMVSNFENVLIRESLTHGNLTLENILWDPSQERIIMIDPYSETYCESVTGDVSQILQSSYSGYEYFSDSLQHQSYTIDQYPLNSLPMQLQAFTEAFLDKLSSESWFSDKYLPVFQASQFTRMFPFKIASNPRLGVLFMMHGITLLEGCGC